MDFLKEGTIRLRGANQPRVFSPAGSSQLGISPHPQGKNAQRSRDGPTFLELGVQKWDLSFFLVFQLQILLKSQIQLDLGF